MSDETNNPLYMMLVGKGRSPWRRKRSHVGKTWKPEKVELDEKVGLWCSGCHGQHPYNNAGKLLSSYEKRGDRWVLMWLCPITGDVVGEITLGNKQP